MRILTSEKIKDFHAYLLQEEKSKATTEKYLRDINTFMQWKTQSCIKGIDKVTVLSYKDYLCEHYAVSSVNSMLSSLNSFFDFCEWYELKVKALKLQRKIFSSSEKELTRAEYTRLLRAAKDKNNQRLYLLLQTICSTGIRVSELRFITVQSLCRGYAEISCKGKRRTVFLPDELCRMLKLYAQSQNIKSGSVFVTRNGNPLDRSNIWSDMKKLCREANVSEKKVFPHNLRHLFARTYYSIQKDIVRLADLLGHASVNTTRIYTMESGDVHRRQIQKLGLLRC